MKKFEVIINKILKNSQLSQSESDFILRVLEEKFDEYQIVSYYHFYLKKVRVLKKFMHLSKFLEKMKKFPFWSNYDTCGTGGDHKNSFNFSTATSIVLSACDVKIAKHGNRSITSKSGSFDVLESLGIKIDLNEKDTIDFLREMVFAFYLHLNIIPH